MIAALAVLMPGATRARAEDAGDAPDAPPPAALAACPGLGAATSDVTPDQARALVLCALNAERGESGVAPLQPVVELESAAEDHTQVMVDHGDLEHGDLPTQLQAYVRGYGYQLGENVGETSGDGTTVGEIIGAWMKSASHRANILDPRFHDVGIGVLLTGLDRGPGATYTTDFGSRQALTAPQRAAPRRRVKPRRRAAVVRRRHR